MERGGRTRSTKSAAEQLREFYEIRLASEDEILPHHNQVREALEDSTQDTLHDWEAVLHPGSDSRVRHLEPIDEVTFGKWVALVSELGGEVLERYKRVVGGLTFVPVRLADNAVVQASRFNPLRALRPLPAMRPIQPGVLRSTPHTVAAPTAQDPQSEARVAIFDGGTVNTPMFPTCVPNDLTPEAQRSDYVSHGSGVTAAVLFGNVEPGLLLPSPAAPVTHHRVLPHPNAHHDPEIYWVLDRIVEEVEQGDYRIVHLSLGPAISVEDLEEPNRWTSTLDELAYEKDVLFVIAAGNNGESDASTGLNRVQVPADLANGLSVGACDRHAPASPWGRAPYSAVGPGRTGSRIQPSGVQFGGDDGNPFYAVMHTGDLMETAGTSFAAPLVTNALAKLAGRLGEERTTTNNLRAFAVHLADRHPEADSLMTEIGHGRLPHDFEDALACGENQALVLYEDRLERYEIASLAIPLPLGIDEGLIELSWTLALNAPTEPTQPLEYTRATIDVTFRPHDQKFLFSKSGRSSRTINVVADAAEAANLYSQGYTAGASPVSFSMPGTSGTEEERRDGGKWETIRTHRKRFRASSLRNPRLELTYLAREGGLLAADAAPIDYSLVISIHARDDIPLYEQVRASFPVLTELPAEVRLRTGGQ